MNIYKKMLFVLLTFTFLSMPRVFSFSFTEEGRLYSDAVTAAKQKDYDVAFANLHTLINIFPNTKLMDKALFALGEYYFSTGDYYDAEASFKRFAHDFPKSRGYLFAMAYLREVARLKGLDSEAITYNKDIISFMQVSLLFRDYKTYKYLSPLYKRYKAVYFIDKVEFYKDDKQFTLLSY